ncbi:MAG: phosphodiester glycosidase family protein [Oscillospiraceae bacterium]|nr:phosphodiester glycosidase family protein [Oscillospiraceae bacterium]
MTELFQNILTASFHGSIVILAVIVLRLLLKKTPKKFFCLLWLLAGIRLLMPFEIKSDLSLQPEPEPIVQQIVTYERYTAPSQAPAQPIPLETLPVVQAPASGETAVFPPAPTEIVSPVETVTIHPVSPRIPWNTLIPWLWLTVASLFLVYTFYAYWRLRLLVREAIRIDGGWECEHIETAFILGFIRPRIYIPMGLSKMVRKHILAHERTHLEKGDHWFKMVGFIALALHWFNPLVWVAYILLCKDIEMACDERVVQFMELQERKEYSAALLNCSTNKVHFAACPVAFGEVSVKTRIKSVLKYKKPGFWISLAGIIAIIFVAVCLVTSPVEHESDLPNTETARAQIHVTVRTVDEFLDAIAPDTRIILEAGTYNLTEASGYAQKTDSEYYSWSEMGDGHQLMLRGVENLTIQGSGKLVTTLSTDPRYANVLVLQNCKNVTLADFTAGHTDGMGECSGGVLNLENCTDISLNSLGLYGCGTVGLTTDLCANVTLTDSDIYECSSSAAVVDTSKDVTISGCRIYDIGRDDYGGYTFFELITSQRVVVEKCELSNSTLNCLMNSASTQVELRNNLFVGNRANQNAFSISGQMVTLDGNKFDGNTIRTWYSGYGNVALDANGDPLPEAKLKELYPSEPKIPTQDQLEIHVSTVDELIAAIGPNKDIVLEGELYDFSTATGYGTSSGDYYYWEDVYDGPGLVIRDVDNMTIRSSSGNVKNHTIAAIPRYADVLAFKACSNVTLSGFTAGHTKEPGSCAGGVIEFRDCDNMLVDNCGLYGCGILGVYAEYSKNIHVINSDIYECSQGGIQMRNTDFITITGNTFRDLGGDETSFISCSNINRDGQLLNPKDDLDTHISAAATEPAAVADEEDLANMGETITHFSYALFRGDEATMRLHLAKSYDIPIEIPEEIQGAMLAANQDLPADYASEMERQGYCTVAVNYTLPVGNEQIQTNMLLEMCREQGVWKVQYYTLDDTEIALLDKVLWNFVWAYFQQDLETMEFLLSDSYTGTVDTYFGNWGDVEWDDSNIVNIDNTFSNAELAKLDSYSIAIPFKANKDSDDYTYLNIALQRRTEKKQYADGRTDSDWEILDYGIDNAAPSSAGLMDLPGGIQVETIERENYTGTVMLIEDPSRVFLGTSTGGEDFSTDIPGKRINEMFDVYPDAVAAVNAGAFFDDGTASAAVGSYPLGLTISQGEHVWSQAQGISPGLEGFAGFNAKNELVVVDHNLTAEEATALDIRDGVGMGPALIIDMEIQPAAEENTGYNPRTAIGQKEDGTVILLCINGRVFNSLGATYADVANEMMALGAVNACLMQGGSATAMAYAPGGSQEPQLLTTISSMDGSTTLQPRRLPTYWMVAAK